MDPGGNPVSYLHYYKLNENIDFVNLRNTIETIVYFTCHRQALYGSVQISYHSILVLREPHPYLKPFSHFGSTPPFLRVRSHIFSVF